MPSGAALFVPAGALLYRQAMAKEVQQLGTVRVGTGGWIFPPWRGTFYPKGLKQADELSYATAHLTTI